MNVFSLSLDVEETFCKLAKPKVKGCPLYAIYDKNTFLRLKISVIHNMKLVITRIYTVFSFAAGTIINEIKKKSSKKQNKK